MRRQFYPGEELCFGGINTWRGVTRAKPFLTGRSYVRIGSIQSGNLVIYPIMDDVDGQGQQLINWTVQVAQPGYDRNDWNKPGRLEDFLPIFAGWTFDWLDVPDLLRRSDVIFEYPMVDRDPVDRWTFGRVTLLGDAAHPMYPRGSNGAAQAILDARALADGLGRGRRPLAALPPTRPRARRRRRVSCAPTASIRPTISSAAWRSWWAMPRSRISTATSPAPSSSASPTSTSASPASPGTTWRRKRGVERALDRRGRAGQRVLGWARALRALTIFVMAPILWARKSRPAERRMEAPSSKRSSSWQTS